MLREYHNSFPYSALEWHLSCFHPWGALICFCGGHMTCHLLVDILISLGLAYIYLYFLNVLDLTWLCWT